MMHNQMNAVPSAPTAVPELGHLKAAADRISQANYNLATFHTRFFGPVPEGGAQNAAEPIACYRNDLTSVFDQISRLEELVNGLTEIG
jgi:hypothetical protein